ncbi:cyclase family protein [Bacillus sp. Marseille-P3661]|uniref:cyclase family protein n=1 Tax=Bacillus sp. Marseille-P3661 TaxID=1936234 RepID=UPI000C81D1FA|nr:cyclase family protein [Bacillus sp. Marseille-P3661]
MKVHDITAPIYEGMPVYKNKPEKQPEINTVTNGHVTESRLCLDLHTGTHVDAPLHMLNNGATIETLSLTDLVRPCKVLDLTHVSEKVTKEDLEVFDIKQDDFVLLKTKNSYDNQFNFEFIYVEETGAKYLADKQIRGVGIDSLGIERAQPGHPTHQTLFQNQIIVIEGLQLKEIAAGDYFMVAAPIKVTGVDAAPARVLLFEGLN